MYIGVFTIKWVKLLNRQLLNKRENDSMSKRRHTKTATHILGHITRTATPRIPKRRHSINPKRRQSRLLLIYINLNWTYKYM